MLKIFTFIFFIAGLVQSYVIEESPEPDSLGNCTALFPRNHVVRRACYSAHAVCRRYNLNPTFVDELKGNTKVYNDMEMKLPSGASVPYSIYEAEPSLFDTLYDKILVQTDPPVPLSEYRRIINDSDFRVARALHRTSDKILLLEMIEITLDYLDEDDVTAVVGNWFQGDFKIIVPLIDDYLPELENITIVAVADNYPKLSEVKKVMNDRNITLQKVNPRDLSPVITKDGREISVEKIRQILDFLKKTDDAMVLPGVEYESVRNTSYPIKSDAALPVWQWMKVYDEIYLNYQHSEELPVIQLMTRNETPAPLAYSYASESTVSATTESEAEDKIESQNSTGFSSLPATTCSSDADLENSSSPILGNENPEVRAATSGGNLEEADTDDPSFTRFSGNRQNKKYNMAGKDSRHLRKQGKASSSESDDEFVSEENFVRLKPNTKNDSKETSAVDINSIREDVVETNPHPTVGNSPQPQFEASSPKDSADHFPKAISRKENGTATFQNKIFTTCALYYLKVNGTQNRVILSEAGILSLPMKRMCDELLRLETYDGSPILVERRHDFKSPENSNLLARTYAKNSFENSRDEPSTTVRNRISFLRTADRSSVAGDAAEPPKVDSNVPPAAPATAVRLGAENGLDEPLDTRIQLKRLSERSASKRSLGRSLEFPISSFDEDEQNSFNHFSRPRSSHPKIRKATRRPNRRRFSAPQTRLEDLFFHEMEALSDSRPDKFHNHRRSKRLPKTPKNYQGFEMPYPAYEADEMDAYATSEVEGEPDFDVAYADEDRFLPKKGYQHFGRVGFSSSYPHRRKNYDINRSMEEEKWKSMREEAEDYEE